jgi:hypothetical protein
MARKLDEPVAAVDRLIGTIRIAGTGIRRTEVPRADLDDDRLGIGERVDGILDVLHLQYAVAIPVAHGGKVGKPVPIGISGSAGSRHPRNRERGREKQGGELGRQTREGTQVGLTDATSRYPERPRARSHAAAPPWR